MSKLQPCDFDALCKEAIEAATRAGEIVRGYGADAKLLAMNKDEKESTEKSDLSNEECP